MWKPFHSTDGGLAQPHSSSQTQACKQDFFSTSINGKADVLLVVTKIFETSEQKFISYNKSQVVLRGDFETLLHQTHPIAAQAHR